MAEAVFARKEVEKLSPPQAVAVFTFAFAPVARLAEDFFVGDGPTDARDGDGEQQEERELMGERHGGVERIDAEKHQGATAMLLRPHPTDDEAVRRMGHPRFRVAAEKNENGAGDLLSACPVCFAFWSYLP
jgi:hypothetical protein